jgi:hypothetical protein
VWKEAMQDPVLAKEINSLTGQCIKRFTPAQATDTHARRYFMGEADTPSPPDFGVLAGLLWSGYIFVSFV